MTEFRSDAPEPREENSRIIRKRIVVSSAIIVAAGNLLVDVLMQPSYTAAYIGTGLGIMASYGFNLSDGERYLEVRQQERNETGAFLATQIHESIDDPDSLNRKERVVWSRLQGHEGKIRNKDIRAGKRMLTKRGQTVSSPHLRG